MTRIARATRWRALVATILVAALLAGCASIPDSSAPNPITPFERGRPVNLVPVPSADADPESVARDFVRAMADPDRDHRAARRFMTDGASSRWDDKGPMTIIDSVGVVVDERSESAIRLRVTATRVGVLAEIGQLRPETGDVVIPVSLHKSGDTWQIDGDIPAGTVTDLAQFRAVYRSSDLYFPDRTGTRLIGDPRWTFGLTVDPSELVDLLLAGRAPDLAGAVEPVASPGTTRRGPVVDEGGEVHVDLIDVADEDTRKRTALAASIVWTLDRAGTTGTYLISADGAPLVEDRAGGWRLADVGTFDPRPNNLHADVLSVLRGGALYRITESGPVPVGGGLGDANDLRAAAVSGGLSMVAVVAERDGRARLLVGEYGRATTEVLAADRVTALGFGYSGDEGYALVDGRPVRWSGNPAAGFSNVAIDATEVATAQVGAISDFQVSPDGVRAALVVGGDVFLAVISVNDRGVPALTGVRRATPATTGSITGIAWATPGRFYVKTATDGAPVQQVPVSGTPPDEVVSGNLKPPLSAISATGNIVYVADRQGVLELRTGTGQADQYWTVVVPGDANLIPVAR